MSMIIDGTNGLTFNNSTTQTAAGLVVGNASPISNGTAVATTSGTAITFTSIPSWVKKITFILNGTSTSGSSRWAFRIGSGSIDSTSYTSCSSISYGVNLASIQGTTSYELYTDSSGNALSGSIEFYNVSGNIWVAKGNFALYGQTATTTLAGTHTTSGTLDRVQLTTTNGTDTFDAGSANILYE